MKGEIKIKSKKLILIVITILCFSLLNCISTPEGVEVKVDPDPVFSIDILGPNTNPERNEWITLMASELPKIGIEVDTFDHTDWSQINPRTWGYPGPYPIPIYDNGGYDILFVGWNQDMDYYPDIFESFSIIPDGNNFYQYDNIFFDIFLSTFNIDFIRENQILWAEEMQYYLYNELPSIPIINRLEVYMHDEDLENWDSVLFKHDYQSMENWIISDQTEFHIAVPVDMSEFCIHKASNVFDNMWLNQIYSGLLKRDQSNHGFYAEDLITSWSTTDGLTYNIELNPNAKWADGTSINASDVEFTYEMIINPSFAADQYGFWSNYVDGETVTIIDEFELNLTFTTQYAYRDSLLALELFPKHIWKDVPANLFASQAETWASSDPSKLIGSGPYYLHTYDDLNSVIRLSRNPYYDDWTGITPWFDDIYFEFYNTKSGALSALAAGVVDFVDCNFFPDISELPVGGNNFTTVLDGNYQEIAINMEHPILGTGDDCPIPGAESANHVRKAIAYTVPRKHIVENITNGLAIPAVSPWNPASPFFNEDLEAYEYNITKAKEHMVLAGYEIDVDSDLDGLMNYDELYVHGTDPYDADSDDDGILDSEEVDSGSDGFVTDPLNSDTDLDGLNDTAEILLYFTDPTDNDTDDDLMPDGYETEWAYHDPNNASDASIDPDQDGLTNYEEYLYGTNPNNLDTDRDGYLDGEEIDRGSDPLDPDSTPKAGLDTPILIICSLSAMLLILYRKKKR